MDEKSRRQQLITDLRESRIDYISEIVRDGRIRIKRDTKPFVMVEISNILGKVILKIVCPYWIALEYLLEYRP